MYLIQVIEAMPGSVVPLAMFFEKVCSPQQKDSPGGFSYCWPGRELFSAFDLVFGSELSEIKLEVCDTKGVEVNYY